MALRIRAYQIIDTTTVVYSAWTPSRLIGRHSTITSFDGAPGWWGRLGSERLPVELEGLKPGSDERIAAVRAFHDACYQAAYEAILAEHPEAAGGRRSMGEIEVTLPK